MNKQELVAAIAEKSGLNKTQAAEAVDALVDSVTTTLKKGGEVRLVGFGTFSVAKRAAREGRNPKTGATIKIAATKAPKFSAGAALKSAVAK